MKSAKTTHTLVAQASQPAVGKPSFGSQVSKPACRGFSAMYSSRFALFFSWGYPRRLPNHHEYSGQAFTAAQLLHFEFFALFCGRFALPQFAEIREIRVQTFGVGFSGFHLKTPVFFVKVPILALLAQAQLIACRHVA